MQVTCDRVRSNGFQFHKGTIKTTQPSDGTQYLGYFNSIKVRLKLNFAENLFSPRQQFQFHKGTIKTYTGSDHFERLYEI